MIAAEIFMFVGVGHGDVPLNCSLSPLQNVPKSYPSVSGVCADPRPDEAVLAFGRRPAPSRLSINSKNSASRSTSVPIFSQ